MSRCLRPGRRGRGDPGRPLGVRRATQGSGSGLRGTRVAAALRPRSAEADPWPARDLLSPGTERARSLDLDRPGVVEVELSTLGHLRGIPAPGDKGPSRRPSDTGRDADARSQPRSPLWTRASPHERPLLSRAENTSRVATRDTPRRLSGSRPGQRTRQTYPKAGAEHQGRSSWCRRVVTAWVWTCAAAAAIGSKACGHDGRQCGWSAPSAARARSRRAAGSAGPPRCRRR
jgi:hypothetical protein